MKKIIAVFSLVLTVLAGSLTAQTDAEMKAWQTYMTPGDVHKMLAEATGEWNEEVTMWMDPNAAPAKSTVSSKTEMIMGGRYQVAKTTGEMMGMPFEGMSVIGYDNAKKVFNMVWIDNFGTGTLNMDGNWDEQTKSITFKGKTVDPMTGKDLLVRQVMKFIDKDTMLLEMYDTRDGKETKTIEIKSTRKK